MMKQTRMIRISFFIVTALTSVLSGADFILAEA